MEYLTLSRDIHYESPSVLSIISFLDRSLRLGSTPLEMQFVEQGREKPVFSYTCTFEE